MNNDQVIIDRDKLVDLEKLESHALKMRDIQIFDLADKIKNLQHKIEEISQGKVVEIRILKSPFFGETDIKFFHPENVKEFDDIREICELNKMMKDEIKKLETKLESMNFYQFMFKKRSLYKTITVWIFMLGFIVLGSSIIDLIIKGIKIILK